MPEAILATRELTRYFGGLAAVRGVSVDCNVGRAARRDRAERRRQDHADQPAVGRPAAERRQRASSAAHDITGLRADRISRLGIGRSYQKTNIFLPFTVFENCRLAAQSRLPSSMRFFGRPRLIAGCHWGRRARLGDGGAGRP